MDDDDDDDIEDNEFAYKMEPTSPASEMIPDEMDYQMQIRKSLKQEELKYVVSS
jgi:hypothetical protein